MRLFVAIFPPMEIREAMSDSARSLRTTDEARWVRPENIHLTLKFLGDVSDDGVEGVSATLESVAARHAPFALAPSGFGGFPRMEKAKVVWIGAKGNPEILSALAKDMEISFEADGFEREKRGFSPHFTVGRAKKRPVRVEAGEAEFPTFDAKEIILVESETGEKGAVYTPLETFRLAERASRDAKKPR